MAITNPQSMSPANGKRKVPLSYLLATWLAARVPYSVLRVGGRFGGFLHYCVAAEKRRNYLSNVTPAVGRPKGFRPWQAFQNHALNVLELLRAMGDGDRSLPDRVVFHGRESLNAALSRGRGIVLTTFHAGNWEICGLVLAIYGYPITTVAGEQLREDWSENIKDWKQRLGIKVVSGRGAPRELYRALGDNRIVALHMDGDVFTRGVTVKFMGKPVTFPRGPAHLARVAGSPILFGYCCREDDNLLHLYIDPPSDPPQTDQAEELLTNRLIARIEECILKDPGQWCIFRKL